MFRDRPTLDAAHVASLRAIADGTLLAELITIYRAESPRRAGALRDALEAQDSAAAEAAAHSLKGASANVGAARLAAICAAIESAIERRDFDTATAQVADVDGEIARVLEALAVELRRPA